MPKTSKKNTTSPYILRTIKKKLQGICPTCGGTLPNHRGICPVWGEELDKKFNDVDNSVKRIDVLVDDLLERYSPEQDV